MADILNCLTGHLTQLRQQLLDTKLLMRDLLPAAYRLQGKPLAGPLDLATVEDLADALLLPTTAAAVMPEVVPAAQAVLKKAPAQKVPAAAAEHSPRRGYSTDEQARILDPKNNTKALAAEFGLTEGSVYSLRSKWKKAQQTQPLSAVPISAEPLGGLEEWVAEPSAAKVQKPQQAAEPELEASPAAAAEPARKTFGLMARAEELTSLWAEREFSHATPVELGEVLNLLRHVPREKRSVEMGLVLDRAEAEHTNRLKVAGKGRGHGSE